MKLSVKALQAGGEEYSLEVENDSVSIGDVKKLLEGMLNMPMEQQSLVHNGRPLSDSQRLCDYSIAEGTKLYMVAKPTPPTTKPVEPSETQPPAAVATPVEIWKNKTIFINLLYLFLRDHFSKEHSRNIIDTFKAELNKIVYDINLDVVELLAIETLKIQAAQPQ